MDVADDAGGNCSAMATGAAAGKRKRTEPQWMRDPGIVSGQDIPYNENRKINVSEKRAGSGAA